MVKGCIKSSRAETRKAMSRLPSSRLKEQCTLLKRFGIQYPEGNKEGAVKQIMRFIYADITNHHYRPPATPDTSMEDKKIITLEDIKDYRIKVIAHIPTIVDLDYIGVTPLERDKSWRQIGSKLKAEKKMEVEDEEP